MWETFCGVGLNNDMLKNFDLLYESLMFGLEFLGEGFMEYVADDVVKDSRIVDLSRRVREEFVDRFRVMKDVGERKKLRLMQVEMRKEFERLVYELITKRSGRYTGKDIVLSGRQIDMFIDKLMEVRDYGGVDLHSLFYLRSDNLDRELYQSVVGEVIVDK